MFDMSLYLADVVGSMGVVSVILAGFINLIFANGVAKDIHALHEKSLEPHLVPGYAWVLSTAIGGIMVAAVYWALHHSSLGK